MDAHETQRDRDRDLDRFLTFVDAVVAIAVTLLVLPLSEFAGELGEESVTSVLREHRPDFFAFLLSFAVVSLLWLAQQRAVSSLVELDTIVVRLLLLWTLTIVILPFATQLVAEAGDETATRGIYMGTMAVSSALLALIVWRIAHNRSISDAEVPPDPATAVSMTVVTLLSLAATLAVPEVGYYPLLVLLLRGRLLVGWRRLRGSADDRAWTA